MREPAESTFQNKFITPSLRADGCLVQKFSDSVGLGIPDLLLGTKFKGGLWAEVKTVRLPQKPDSFVKIHWRPGQKRWLKFWNHQPLATFVIVGWCVGSQIKPDYRWVVCPGHCLFYLDRLTRTNAEKVCCRGEVTIDKFREAAVLFERSLDIGGQTRL